MKKYTPNQLNGRLGNKGVLQGTNTYNVNVNVDVSIVQRNKKFILSIIEYISESYPEDGIVLKKESKEFDTLEKTLDYVKEHTIVKIEDLHF